MCVEKEKRKEMDRFYWGLNLFNKVPHKKKSTYGVCTCTLYSTMYLLTCMYIHHDIRYTYENVHIRFLFFLFFFSRQPTAKGER